MLLLKIWISYAIPDIPSWVATEMAKIEFRRRAGEKNLNVSFFSNSIGSSLDTVEKFVQTEDLSPPSPEISNIRLRPKITSL